MLFDTKAMKCICVIWQNIIHISFIWLSWKLQLYLIPLGQQLQPLCSRGWFCSWWSWQNMTGDRPCSPKESGPSAHRKAPCVICWPMWAPHLRLWQCCSWIEQQGQGGWCSSAAWRESWIAGQPAQWTAPAIPHGSLWWTSGTALARDKTYLCVAAPCRERPGWFSPQLNWRWTVFGVLSRKPLPPVI